MMRLSGTATCERCGSVRLAEHVGFGDVVLDCEICAPERPVEIFAYEPCRFIFPGLYRRMLGYWEEYRLPTTYLLRSDV